MSFRTDGLCQDERDFGKMSKVHEIVKEREADGTRVSWWDCCVLNLDVAWLHHFFLVCMFYMFWIAACSFRDNAFFLVFWCSWILLTIKWKLQELELNIFADEFSYGRAVSRRKGLWKDVESVWNCEKSEADGTSVSWWDCCVLNLDVRDASFVIWAQV